MNRSSADIQNEIVASFGFFPPFFAPALETPEILENLWQQTLSFYVNSPLPALFKEQLAALLVGFSPVPLPEISGTADLPPAAVLSDLCLSIFQNRNLAESHRSLRELLDPQRYQHLVLFLNYLRLTQSWAEAYPELSLRNEVYKSEELVRRQLADLFMQASVPMTMMIGKDHRFVLANPSYEDLIGQKVVGRVVADVFAGEINQTFSPLLDRVFETGEPYMGREVAFQDRWLDFGYYPLRGHDGAVVGITAIVVDISNQVKLRQAVQESEHRFRMVADSVPVMLVEYSANGALEYTNKTHAEYFGKDLSALRSGEWSDLYHPDDSQRVREDFAQHLLTGRIYERETRLKRHDGVYRWHLIRSEPIRDASGNVVKWYASATDIHEVKLVREELVESRVSAEAANVTKSAFLANMSHEIRSPLGAIMGFTDLLKSSELSDEDKSYLAVIDRNSHQLLRIVDDILDLSKVEAGKMLIEDIHFSLPELLADFSSLYAFKARDKGINFELYISTLIPDVVVSDPTRLRQILTNVVGNAIKFTDRGKVMIEIAYRSCQLIFTVTDTGAGISEEQAAKLFQPFQQADASTTRKFGGTGLGLILSRKLSEAMGGSFYLKSSQEGRGSVFITCVAVTLPEHATMLDSRIMKFVTQPLLASVQDSRTFRGMRVLVVEDSPDNQMLIRLMLQKLRVQVEIAINGRHGSRLALANAYDLILMDLQMPEMDGYEATDRLRSQGYRGPIIALTAHAMKDERDRAIRAGFTDFLSKPIQREALTNVLAKFFETEPASDPGR